MTSTACTISASEPLGTSSDAALECNASTLDELVNGSTTVTSRAGKQLKSIAQLEQDYFVVAVNNGIWALGQIFTAYNQFMVFGGTAYRPKSSTTLPYPIEATPNLTFVEPVTTVNLRADQVTYDNASSGLAATDAQEAIDEIDSQVDTNTGNIATNTTDIGTNTGNIATNTAAISVLQADNPNNQTGTSYTLVLDDRNKTVWMDNAAANTLTISTNASAAFDIKTNIMIMMEGAGVTTITADTGVTLNGIVAGSVDISAQYSGATLVKRATDTWIITGNIGTVA